jgi:DHA1 family bicyclomycin/chloramphenicol resistance-like MFS transporter
MPPRAAAKPHPKSLTVGAILTALVALGQISTSLFVPSMPFLVEELAADAATVHLSFSVFLFGFACCQLIYGPLSDRLGRRPVLLTGIALYMAASVYCALASTIEALIIGRLVLGMAACAGPVLGRAIVRDIYGPTGAAQAMAYIGAALAISPAVAPTIGGVLQMAFGWRSGFVFLTVVGAFVLIATWRLLRETNPQDQAQPLSFTEMIGAYGRLMATRSYYGYTLATSLIFAGLMAFTAASPFVFIDVLDLSPAQFGLLSIFNVAGFVAGSLTAARLTPRFGLDRMLMIGLALCVTGGLLMTAPALAGHVSVALIIAPMMIFTAGMGLVLPNGMAGAMAPFPRIAGAASALLGFVQMVVSGITSVAVGAFADSTHLPMAATIAVTALAGLLSFTLLVGRHRPPQP